MPGSDVGERLRHLRDDFQDLSRQAAPIDLFIAHADEDPPLMRLEFRANTTNEASLQARRFEHISTRAGNILPELRAEDFRNDPWPDRAHFERCITIEDSWRRWLEFVVAHDFGFQEVVPFDPQESSRDDANASGCALRVHLVGSYGGGTAVKVCDLAGVSALALEYLLTTVEQGLEGKQGTRKLRTAGADPSGGAAGEKPKRKRRRRKTESKTRALTAIQAEVVHIVGECKGNISEAARRLGKNRKTVDESYKSAMKKLGKSAVKHQTKRLSSDRRGQENLSQEDDRRG